MSTHATFSPSSTYRLIRCPASANFDEDQFEDETHTRTEEGNRAHAMIGAWLPAIAVKNYDQDTLKRQMQLFDNMLESLEKTPSGDLKSMQDIIHGMKYFGRFFISKMHQFFSKGYHIALLLSEQRLGGPKTGGTPDVIVILVHPGESQTVCLVFDYKHGFSEIEADGGPLPSCPKVKSQVLHYLTLCRNELEYAFDVYGGWVVQPFGDRMKGITSGGSVKLRDVEKFSKMISIAIEDSLMENPTVNPGGTQCYRCLGRTRCDKFQKIVGQLHQIAGGK